MKKGNFVVHPLFIEISIIKEFYLLYLTIMNKIHFQVMYSYKHNYLMLCALLILILLFSVGKINAQEKSVAVKWDNVVSVSKTTPTLQVVVNPIVEEKFSYS